jgi:thiol-disulfide isomerase/thioredoxin
MEVKRSIHALVWLVACACATACASRQNTPAESKHGTISTLSAAPSANADFCEHRVPRDVCTRHHPHLVAKFKEAGDWCVEHGVPESQCYECHPDLSFEPLPELPPDADLKKLSERGEDVPSLEAHVVTGKVTVFDFYADWCGPCRKIDAHMFTKMQARKDIALRKLNVVSWDMPLAKHYLGKVESLPYVVVYGRDGRLVRAISGFDLAALDQAIEEGAKR